MTKKSFYINKQNNLEAPDLEGELHLDFNLVSIQSRDEVVNLNSNIQIFFAKE